jgi:hypothetical protein
VGPADRAHPHHRHRRHRGRGRRPGLPRPLTGAGASHHRCQPSAPTTANALLHPLQHTPARQPTTPQAPHSPPHPPPPPITKTPLALAVRGLSC